MFKDFCILFDPKSFFFKCMRASSLDIIDEILKTDISEFEINEERKCNAISTDFRSKGNIYFNSCEKDMKNVFLIYTQALYYAETETEKSFNFGNRSSVLFKMGYYNECIIDIDKAIEYNYPSNKIAKLLLRKAEALVMLQKYSESELCLNSDQLYTEKSLKGCNDFQRRICDAKLKCLNRKIFEEFTPNIKLKRYYPTANIHLMDNHIIRAFSKKLYLSNSGTEGRCILANDDIIVGEILAVESPYAYRLTSDNMMTHCYYCLHQNFNLIPCENCCRVGFCNEQCQKLATDVMRHDLECGLMHQILSTHSKELGLLAYGLVSRTCPEIVRQSVKRFINGGPLDADHTIDSNDYRSVLNIVTNESLRTTEDLSQRCSSAVYLALCLVKKLFGNEKESTKKEWLRIFSVAFVNHLQGIPCNAHSLGEHMVSETGSVVDSYTNYVGNGLYPALSMINHSCAPNVVRVTMDRGVCVLRAVAPISSGEQILDNYSIHFATMDLEDRHRQLRDQYHFECRCVACRDHWPTFAEQLQRDNVLKVRCPRCMCPVETGRCPRCLDSVEARASHLAALESMLPPTMERMIGGDIGGIEAYLIELSTELQSLATPPSLALHQATEMIKVLWSLEASVASSF